MNHKTRTPAMPDRTKAPALGYPDRRPAAPARAHPAARETVWKRCGGSGAQQTPAVPAPTRAGARR